MSKAEFKAYPSKTPEQPPLMKGGQYITFLVDELFLGKTRVALFGLGLKPFDAIKVTVEKWSDHGTDAQNRLFHKILSIYHKSGHSSFNDMQDLKDYLKCTYGEVGEMRYLGGKPFFNGLKSWSQFSLKQRMMTIDGMIGEMLTLGIDIDTEVTQWGEMKSDGKREVSDSGTENGDTSEGPLEVQVRTARKVFGSPDSPDKG